MRNRVENLFHQHPPQLHRPLRWLPLVSLFLRQSLLQVGQRDFRIQVVSDFKWVIKLFPYLSLWQRIVNWKPEISKWKVKTRKGRDPNRTSATSLTSSLTARLTVNSDVSKSLREISSLNLERVPPDLSHKQFFGKKILRTRSEPGIWQKPPSCWSVNQWSGYNFTR